MVETNNYFIVAMEAEYQGLHGMVDYAIEPSIDYNEACGIGEEMSRCVMCDYQDIMNILEDRARDYVDAGDYDDFDGALEDAISDNVYFMIYKIRDDVNLADIDMNLDWEEIANTYCEEL